MTLALGVVGFNLGTCLSALRTVGFGQGEARVSAMDEENQETC